MRLINADLLKGYLGMETDCNDCKESTSHCGNIQIYTKMDICSAIDEQPTVYSLEDYNKFFSQSKMIIDAMHEEPKQCKWEFDKNGFTVCSNCKERALWNSARIQAATLYCPYCGAKMR